MGERSRATRAVFGSALRNGVLRRVELSYGLFSGAEWAVWIALLVFAYQHGGASASARMAVIQLVPCALLSPLLGALIDRARAGRVLLAAYLVQGLTMAAMASAIAAGAPVWVTFVLAPLVCLAISATRPAYAALLPSIVRTPAELTASNVMTGWVEHISRLAVPALAGVLLAVNGPGLAIAVTAAMTVGAALSVWPIPGPPARPGERSVRDGLRRNLSGAWRDRPTRLLLSLEVFYQAFVGALDLLCVVLAVSVLGLGRGGAGYLNAVLAAGGLLAGGLTAFLVGRHRLVGVMAAGIVGATVALALLAVDPSVAGAFVILAVVGLSGSVFEVSGNTLLQRAAPSDALAGIFAVREALMDVGLVLGTVIVGIAVSAGGYRVALIAPAVLALLLLALLWRPLGGIDAAADVPQVEIQLLRSIRIFAALPAPVLEGVARRLVPVATPSGKVVVREGDDGDRYYAVADGLLSVWRTGKQVATLGRGDGFGEIALVHDVPRVASVIADSECLLYELDREPFVLLLTGHPAADREARSTSARLLAGEME